ncbi:bifunctional glycosyltransferase family 2 protein/CDP-glycerol:glycerophosphate glycerophosphotransferase [Staphylococcus sp. SQ8-PEA]|uniref:Bifunctional glycosyltransferase family 2 protein/CDP-glycerol:glycerophosphate glycerophosphotransferase n=1 Tax=Staphylococcus marylandisciuri TaxID=2981529 RepID=A0ABT2QN14_9STAP|nr:CDP-glycerol:glycerophosphate glycerophosphotransferase [Staphylococcus marylandisciuri]MCU5745344.1 bifunctional glycosyltransferase family 2 protein/CDP-glycerol:glycerophosphate glycerophosphotransferase [Staphylococcus marylandisciuri]
MNNLTVIVPYYNSEDTILDCIDSLKSQRYQEFNYIFVNDGSSDKSAEIVDKATADIDSKRVQHINLTTNNGHAHARNVGMSYVETPYFMFVDADDTLASYALTFYIEHLNQSDALIAPIHKFSVKTPQYVDLNKVKVKYYEGRKNLNSFLRKNSVCNIILRTGIVRAHDLKFDEDLQIYADQTFILQYINYVDRFVRLFGFPFYFRGELLDPFNTLQLTEQAFDLRFDDYLNSFYKSLKVAQYKENKEFMKQRMVKRLLNDFDPSHIDIDERYTHNSSNLIKISKSILTTILKSKKPLFGIEMILAALGKPAKAQRFNRLRYKLRHLKRVLLRQKGKELSRYKLTDKPENVNNKTIVFEAFGGKNYSDSPKYIYEYMASRYPNYNYKWVLKNPSKAVIPGNAEVVKKGSRAYFDALSEASHWVANARLPLYVDKKPNQKYYQTWHGTPLKRLAGDQKFVRMPGTTTAKYKLNFRSETDRWDYLISPNRYSTEIFQSAFWMDRDRILETGYPRNDILVNKCNDKAFSDKIRERLNITKGKKVIMYAPTWRDDEFVKKGQYLFNLKIDLENLYEQLGNDTVILLRMHYLIANALDLSGYEDFAIDVSSYDDVSELFLISDALITDYSSVMFDYGILKRPQFFFAYDIEKYDKGLRGFYMDYESELPGPIYTDAYQLTESLKDLDKVQEEYQSKIDKFYDKFCSIEQGNASKVIGDKIADEIEQ